MAVGLEGAIQLWSLPTWQLLIEFSVGTKAINHIAISKDNHWLAAGAADQKVRIWPLDFSGMI
jgi:WD40 repeat protein